MFFSSRRLATSLLLRRSIHTVARSPVAAVGATGEQGVLVYDAPEFKCKIINIKKSLELQDAS